MCLFEAQMRLASELLLKGWQHTAVSHCVETEWTQGRAADIKAKGNAAFSSGNFDEAITLFTSCIQLDPE